MIHLTSVTTLVVAACCCLLATSCKKSNEFSNTTVNSEAATSFKKLTVSDNFNWKNDRMVSFTVQPLQMSEAIYSTIRVKVDGNPTAIYSALIAMNAAHSATFKVPSHVEEVTISFGSIVKIVPIVNNSLSFNFYPEN